MVKKICAEEEEEEEEQFHVEVITKARVTHSGKWEYYVKWAGYGSEADSWEPGENVAECDRLLKSFWRHVGWDNEDYEAGQECVASDDWIEKEKQFFHENFGQPEKVVKKKKKKRGEIKVKKAPIGKAVVKSKNAKGKTVMKKPIIEDSDSEYEDTDSESGSDDDIPLMAKAESSKTGQKRAAMSATDSDDSDTPLRKAPRRQSLSTSRAGKGKEPVRPRPSTPTPAQPDSEMHSLFSEPPTPEVISKKKASDAAPKPSTSGSVANSSALLVPTSVPSKPPVASHKNREPKVKTLSLPVSNDAFNFTETKRRLAERTGTLQPTKTAVAPPADAPPAKQKKVLAGLSFKKNRSATDPAPQQSPVTPATAEPRGDGWGSGPSHTDGWGNSGGWGAGGSPTDAWGVNRSPSPGRGEKRASSREAAFPSNKLPGSLTEPRHPPSRPPPTTKEQRNKAAADVFLSTIMPAQLAAPMHEPTGDEMDQDIAPPPRIPVVKKPQPPQDPAKKWEWSGELYMETGPSKSSPASRLCHICLKDGTIPRPLGLRLSVCYNSALSVLRLEKFHDISDVYLLLRACSPVQQFCKVVHKDAADEGIFKTLTAYMIRRRQFAYARASMDNEPVGVLLIFPSAISEICSTLKLASQMRASSSPLMAALIPWKLTADQYRDTEWQKAQESLNPADGRIEPRLAESIDGLSRTLTAKPYYARGLRIHHFTVADYDFFKRAPRKYCIWNAPSDGTIKEPGFETKTLIAILDAWKAENAGYKADVRVVFVHVGALRSVHKLEALALRRSKRPEMRFYTYGTHHSVSPERWGVREIYPLGGVVTFTAKAIVEDPFQIYRLIDQISQHPLWMCYVHPCVLAAVAKISYPGADILSLLGQDDFFYTPLLELIEEGKISLLHAPPKSRSPHLAENDTSRTVDPGMDWATWALGICALDGRGIMKDCLRLFEERHRGLPDKDIAPVVEQEVSSDLVQMHLEPVIMDNYRRFVMVVETRNDQSLEVNGVELVPTPKFDFKDEYFSAT